MKTLLLLLLLLFLSVPCHAATLRITVTLDNPYGELIPAGYGLEASVYDTDIMDIGISDGPPFDLESAYPNDTPLLRVLCGLDSPKQGLTIKSIVIDVTTQESQNTAFLTHTFEVQLENTNALSNPSFAPAFHSAFRTNFGGVGFGRLENH